MDDRTYFDWMCPSVIGVLGQCTTLSRLDLEGNDISVADVVELEYLRLD